MTDLTITATVTRTALSLSALSLNDHTSYEIASVGPGGRTWVRDVATAPSVHGATQVSARMDMQTAPLVVRVLAASKAQLDTRSAALVAAFSQLTYNLTVTIDGGTETWHCWAADIDIASDGGGAGWDKYSLMVHRQEYSLRIPRQPVPAAGVM